MQTTFEYLLQAFPELLTNVREIKSQLHQLTQTPNQNPTDQWFDLKELCDYVPEKPKKQTAYGWVHNLIIPYHKRGKKLFFLKSEIDQWLKAGRKKTLAETASEADNYLSNRKK